MAYVEGTPAGYFELELQLDADLEIAYFGLLRGFAGAGLGGWLLTRAIDRGWEAGARRVWVQTCSLDGPHALGNYLARGMKVFGKDTTVMELPEAAPGPWPGWWS